MAMRRRRRFRRSFAGKKGGREFFWLRFQPFFMTNWASDPLVLSDIIVTESTWSNPSQDINQTRRGGPRLERFICNFGLAIEGDEGFFSQAGAAEQAFIPEVMAWTQTDQTVTQVTNSTQFDLTLQNERVIMHEVPGLAREFTHYRTDGGGLFRLIRTVQGRYESVSKVRLAERAIGMAWRGNVQNTASSFRGFTDWVQPTMLISIP